MHLTGFAADPCRIQCANRCQGRLWLVDGGSEFVFHALGYPYAIACGPAVGGYPGLCIATAARADGQSAANEPDDDADDAQGQGASQPTAADWFQQAPLPS
jgi:hypothetical protein